ncbi:polymorphic toxin-type HINT domain-containing protein [Nocardioides palaemonis]|uniref:polymorphic toxin-type HINT domain-containing protein n=1 Tax=Nocardioides palaemonis TaxID=2829810 RepID=UPI0027DC6DD2|nr:polymorphic toxin-type HINT domain-containing protein [Nocardioides palaemonis]
MHILPAPTHIDADQMSPIRAADPFYHLDRMGSVRAVTNSTAASQWTSEWEPYGLPRTSTKVDPNAAVNPIGWTGQYADPTGSVHLRARQYDPALGRFTAPDQAAAMPYSATGTYAAGNPLAFADPTGLWPSPGDVWNVVTTGAAVVAPIAGMAAPFSGPLAPIVGGVAIAAGAITAIDSAYNAYQVCGGNEKGSCAGEIALGAVGMATGGLGRTAIRSSLAARTAARSCSFTGATVVLMADGTKKPIEDIKVGDRVIATDPETGEQSAKAVTHTWVHDDMVMDLVVDGEVITTTEDHPFWSVTDQRFERADELAADEQVLGADGRVLPVSGLELETSREGLAYNLSIEGIHTYHVGDAEILVHNTCSIHGNSLNSPKPTTLYRLDDANGNLLKWGVTSRPNARRRYTETFLRDKQFTPITVGPRSQMIRIERWMVEHHRGPLNRESWAGGSW